MIAQTALIALQGFVLSVRLTKRDFCAIWFALFFVLLPCKFTMANSQSEGALKAYQDTNCQSDETRYFQSLNDLKHDDQLWLSYIDMTVDEEECIEIELPTVIATASRLPARVVFWGTTFSTLQSITRHYKGKYNRWFTDFWSDNQWNALHKEMDACWRQQADAAKGVTLPDLEYNIRNATQNDIDELGFATGYFRYGEGTPEVIINPSAIMLFEPKSFYNAHVETGMHEVIHIERRAAGIHNSDDVWEEWHTQVDTWNRWKKMYPGIQPPSKPRSFFFMLGMEAERRHLKAKLEVARESGRSGAVSSAETRLANHENEMKKSPYNRDYTGVEIPKCD